MLNMGKGVTINIGPTGTLGFPILISMLARLSADNRANIIIKTALPGAVNILSLPLTQAQGSDMILKTIKCIKLGYKITLYLNKLSEANLILINTTLTIGLQFPYSSSGGPNFNSASVTNCNRTDINLHILATMGKTILV